ncbi:relaxase/mobilization nuclease domain-containing protein [Staphylococcus aureus]
MITPEQCNQLGLELAEKIAPNHQVAVYTHTDKEHVHNHIVINSIDLEAGRKYQSNKQQRDFVKQASQAIFVENKFECARTRYVKSEIHTSRKNQYDRERPIFLER